MIVEGWAASAQAAPTLFKSCTYAAISNGLPVLDRIAVSPQQPVRVLTVLIG